MMIRLYDISPLKMVGCLKGASFSYTQKSFDFDDFSAEGILSGNITNAKVWAICHDDGTPLRDTPNLSHSIASGMVNQWAKKRYYSDRYSLTGLDFKKLMDSDAYIDLSAYSSAMTLFDFAKEVSTSPFGVEIADYYGIPSDAWGASGVYPWNEVLTNSGFDSLGGSAYIKNAWSFMKPYIAFYHVPVRMFLTTRFERIENSGSLSGWSKDDSVGINIDDFRHSESSRSNTISVAIPYISASNLGMAWYLTKNGDIRKFSAFEDMSEAIWPIRTVYVKGDTLAEAQNAAILALADARFQQSIEISDSDKHAPKDISSLPLGQWFKVYYNDGTYQYLPMSEKTISCKNGILSYSVKLGEKKSFLTDYIRKVI